jgi:hypothetical protein
MILWTIQHIEAWQRAQCDDVLRATQQYAQASYDDAGNTFLPAYEWLAAEMWRRVGAPPSGIRYPVWAWAQCGTSGTTKPTLSDPGHLPPRTRGVCIEFEMPDDQVLLSDFDLWAYVLLGPKTYIPRCVEEMELLDELGARDFDVYTDAEIRSSWERIFDLDFAAPDIAVPRVEKWIQATVWEVPLTTVRVVEEFVAPALTIAP